MSSLRGLFTAVGTLTTLLVSAAAVAAQVQPVRGSVSSAPRTLSVPLTALPPLSGQSLSSQPLTQPATPPKPVVTHVQTELQSGAAVVTGSPTVPTAPTKAQPGEAVNRSPGSEASVSSPAVAQSGTDVSTESTAPTTEGATSVESNSVESIPPDVKLIRNGSDRGGSKSQYWLEVTPPTAPLPTNSTAAAPTQKLPPSRQRSTRSPRPLVSQQVVQSVETTGYQGVPAPPAINSSTALSNYIVSTSSTSNYRPQPSVPQSLGLPDDLEELGRSIRYPLPSVVPVTSGFGWRIHPITGERRFHSGVDLGAAYGTPVLSSLSGQVVAVGDDGGYGLRVLIQSQLGDRPVQILYAHLSTATVQIGQVVESGQVIGQVGSSGAATGPHLHVELREFTANQWQSIDSQPLLTAALQGGDTQGWSLLTGSNTNSAVAGLAQPLPVNSGVTIRVALAHNVAAVRLASSTPAWVLDAAQRPIGMVNQQQSFVTAPNAQGVQLGSIQLPSVFFLQPSAGGSLSVGSHWYRGRVLIVAGRHGLTVVNWVNLEHYLVSVVGAEAYPSWRLEALKAQAVAARSYALRFHVNPVSDLFDLDDSIRYQAYNGLVSEYNTTAQAVSATSGQVLLDAAGQILLAEYATTQELTDSAHGGFGLSQWGAASLAQQGYDYRQILGHYYTGASLTVLSASAR